MGASKGKVANPEPVVTPAVARSIEGDTSANQQTQAEARQRMRGIRSTYAQFASTEAKGGASKLG